ncbi:bidirectional sugar transporter N3-like [Musa acuminata AAA Group]|uniref:bidirectional sugar transporter N3-like n=1 Tax=Musa acuminata AAA Group TaxID=214697 RepID=UPI0031D3C849
MSLVDRHSLTFYRIYRNKSTGEFQSTPYVFSLFSCSLWVYYALVKTHSVPLITNNAFGCLIEATYITMYLIYATKKARIFTIRVFVLVNVVAFAAILLLTQPLITGTKRVTVLGWICVAFSLSVYAAPLGIMMRVIRTRSVECMPFNIPLFHMLSAIAWFGYGLFTDDVYVELPNVPGFVIGVGQMVLYAIYRKKSGAVVDAAEHEVKVAQPTPSPASVRQHIVRIAEHVVRMVELDPTLDSEPQVIAGENDREKKKKIDVAEPPLISTPELDNHDDKKKKAKEENDMGVKKPRIVVEHIINIRELISVVA